MPARTHAPRGVLRAFAVVLVVPVTLVAAADRAAAELATRLDLSVSGHFSRGDYGGDDDIDIVYVPVVAKVDAGPWGMKIVVPYLRISGGTTVVEGPSGPITTPAETAEGLGDVIWEASYTFAPPRAALPFVELGAKLKLPTADEGDGLGTGEFDVTPAVEVSQKFGRWTPYGELGFRVLGDPSPTTYRDGFLASGGTTYELAEGWEVGAFVYWKQSASAGGDDSLEALPVLRWNLGEHWIVDAYVSAGLSDAVPDVGSGLQLHWRAERD